MDWGFHRISTNLVDFCNVIIGTSITNIANSYVGVGDLLVNWISTFVTWVVGTATFLVAIKTLSGKNNIGDAFKYFKNGIINLFKKEENGRNNKSNKV